MSGNLLWARVAGDHAAAVPLQVDDGALPVVPAVLVGLLHLAQKL